MVALLARGERILFICSIELWLIGDRTSFLGKDTSRTCYNSYSLITYISNRRGKLVPVDIFSNARVVVFGGARALYILPRLVAFFYIALAPLLTRGLHHVVLSAPLPWLCRPDSRRAGVADRSTLEGWIKVYLGHLEASRFAYRSTLGSLLEGQRCSHLILVRGRFHVLFVIFLAKSRRVSNCCLRSATHDLLTRLRRVIVGYSRCGNTQSFVEEHESLVRRMSCWRALRGLD